jgi:hypothetical protein
VDLGRFLFLLPISSRQIDESISIADFAATAATNLTLTIHHA